jgi:hypothetical protein
MIEDRIVLAGKCCYVLMKVSKLSVCRLVGDSVAWFAFTIDELSLKKYHLVSCCSMVEGNEDAVCKKEWQACLGR